MENTTKNDSQENQNINYTFKLLYAIGIIFIVAGHCEDGGISVLFEIFPPYSFHLALFIFASGYFFKPEHVANIKNFIVHKTKKLIVPLILWNIFYGIILLLIQKFGFFPDVTVNFKNIFIAPFQDGHQFILNLGGWFIIPLFIIHLLNIIIRKLFNIFNIKFNEIIFFMLCLTLGIFGIYLTNHDYNTGIYLNITRTLYFLPFFSAGILYKKYESQDNTNNLLYYSAIFILALYCIYKYNGMPVYAPSWSSFHNNPIIPFVTGFIGIAFWLRTAKILTPAIGKSKYVNLLANNTYTIMINHLLGFMLVKSFYALCFIHKLGCSNFNMDKFKTDVFWFYTPQGTEQMLFLYLISGIVFPIVLQTLIKKIFTRYKIQ